MPARLLEVAVVTVSRLNECTCCVSHHTPNAIDTGLSPEVLENNLELKLSVVQSNRASPLAAIQGTDL